MIEGIPRENKLIKIFSLDYNCDHCCSSFWSPTLTMFRATLDCEYVAIGSILYYTKLFLCMTLTFKIVILICFHNFVCR